MENIFTTLYKYKPQPEITPAENFFTESLKIVLSLDNELLNKFVRCIAGETAFKAPFMLESQVRYGNSIIDLQITDKSSNKILIEIKVNAHENRYIDEDNGDDFGQVEKYLRLNKGYVCFIAKDQGNIVIKNNADKFLGQFEWFEIYRLIDEYLRKNKLDKTKKYFITNFLKFMKELDMQPFQGFNNKDIQLSKTNFLDLYDKLLDFLFEITKDKRIKGFCRRHKLIITNNTPKFTRRDKEFRLDLGRKGWGSWNKKISVVLFFDLKDKQEPGLYFSFNVGLDLKLQNNKYLEEMEKIKINKKYFNLNRGEYWILEKWIYFPKFIKAGESQAIDYIHKTLLELEKSGVLDVLKKLR